MVGYDQQDAHEFLMALLDGIETHSKMHHRRIFLTEDNDSDHGKNGNGSNGLTPRGFHNIVEVRDLVTIVTWPTAQLDM